MSEENELQEITYRLNSKGELVPADKETKKPLSQVVQDEFWLILGKGKKDKPPEGKPSKSPKGVDSIFGDYKPSKSYKPPEKWISAGGVVLGGPDDWEHVYIRKPSNNYGPWSFPKGKVDKGESKEQAALREVEEEAGIVADILPGGYLGTGEGSHSVTHYYLMVAQKNLRKTDKETEKVLLASWTEAVHKFAKGGNTRDINILNKAMDMVEMMKRKQGGHR